eukprot:TRINITY_DN5637_c0_g1_i1.p1 TRINITY_DN5637_c0_g1~~TRINITY_DN5637_c0_g1_i1.p1  ORF type:complete len:270 (-),score=31.32 TRINITY_DN5637_c0_g1_i1:41-850(-)
MQNGEYEIHKNIAYAQQSRKNCLDVYVPRHANSTPVPVVIHIHGGGWVRGDRSYSFYGSPSMCRAYAQRGFISVAVSYRLGKHPHHIEDCALAFKWVHENIAKFGGDNSRVFASGHSAGAHLASLLATDPKWLMGVGLEPGFIIGVIAVSGIYHVSDPFHSSAWARKWIFNKMYVSRVFGHSADLCATVSPLLLLAQTKYLPPFLVLNASFDLGLEHDGRRFAEELQAAGCTVAYKIVQGTRHATIPHSAVVHDQAAAFIKSNFHYNNS